VEVLEVRGDFPEAEAAAVGRAVAALDAGGLLIYPTDTLYAIGGRALDAAAAGKVRAAKGRDVKPLPVVAADLDQVTTLVTDLPAAALRLAESFWPGPLTVILASRGDVPDEVTAGTGTVAVRVPALALARRLCRAAGPLISTSANLAGAPAPRTCREAVAGVGAAAVLALDAGPGRPVASTIVDLTCEPPRLVRPGAVPWGDVLASLQAG
jgi:L-threonylcarbamoyladenylate synthase